MIFTLSYPDLLSELDGGAADGKCLKHKAEADEKSGKRRMVGHFVPSCDADGGYSAVQTHASTGHSWCALADGSEVPGTKGRGVKTAEECNVHRKAESEWEKGILLFVCFC